MSIGTVILLVVIGGSLFAMFSTHRGGQTHNIGMGCGGHSGRWPDAEHRHGGSHQVATGPHPSGEAERVSDAGAPAHAPRHRRC